MNKPTKIIKAERNVLAIIARGHPDRTMETNAPYGKQLVNALTWSEIQTASQQPWDEVGDCIAHLIGEQFIESARTYPGFIRRLLGEEGVTYFWVTKLGQAFLDEHSSETIPEKIELPGPESLTGYDIQEAVTFFENSLTPSPYCQKEKIEWARKVLDPDIKDEIKIAASELENMWCQFEKQFGHRGPAKNLNERSLRDPVVKKTTVRIIRALDEQLKRKSFCPSIKPDAWKDYLK